MMIFGKKILIMSVVVFAFFPIQLSQAEDGVAMNPPAKDQVWPELVALVQDELPHYPNDENLVNAVRNCYRDALEGIDVSSTDLETIKKNDNALLNNSGLKKCFLEDVVVYNLVAGNAYDFDGSDLFYFDSPLFASERINFYRSLFLPTEKQREIFKGYVDGLMNVMITSKIHASSSN